MYLSCPATTAFQLFGGGGVNYLTFSLYFCTENKELDNAWSDRDSDTVKVKCLVQ